jgi:hypothetical protein
MILDSDYRIIRLTNDATILIGLEHQAFHTIPYKTVSSLLAQAKHNLQMM